jgi:two-component system, NtrC family, sensor kinase
MWGHTALVPDWPGARIPEFVRELTTTAIAVISRDGILIDANLGFFQLLPDDMTSADMLDVRDLFLNPRFDQFVTRRPSYEGAAIYKGILNVAGERDVTRSLHGSLFALKDSVLIVAEHEVAGLDLLRAKVLRLNDELVEEQRKLNAALREAKRHKRLAEIALKERDALLATCEE